MSTIIYSKKSVAVAAGLRWSVLDAPIKKARASIRNISKSVGATRYSIDRDEDQNYLGLYTPGPNVMGLKAKRAKNIHSLALLFISAMLRSSDIDRSMIHAVLAVSPTDDHQNELRALVVIDGGKIIHDGVETRGRVAEIIADYQGRDDAFQVFSDRDEYQDVTVIDWDELADHANKSTITQAVPVNPAAYGIAALVLLGVAGQGAYYTLVTIPKQKAEEARRRAEQDRTPLYLKALQEAMQNVGWSTPSIISHIQKINSDTYYYKGWGLKTLECNVSACTETWTRYGGSVSDLIAMRPGGQYLAEQSIPDKVAMVRMPIDGQAAVLTQESFLRSGIEVHQAIKPALNKLDNAGANSQWGESSSWPVMPMTGVRQDAVVKRTSLQIHFKYPFTVDTLLELPASYVPESFTVGMEQEMSISIKGFFYEK